MGVTSSTLRLSNLAIATGTYVFNTFLDAGAVYNSRVMLGIESEVYDTVSDFDSAAGLFDDREGLFDGADRASTLVEAYIKTTSSDPTGSTSPSDGIWSDWKKFVVGDFTARAYWVKIEVYNLVLTNNISISALSLTVDVPDREEKTNDQVLASGGTTITYAKPFFSKPSFGLTIQSTVSGDTPKYTHVTSGGKWTGVTVQILNGGSGVGRTVDFVVKGY